MSCPNRCLNDFKVKDVPDQIECVVTQKLVGCTLEVPGAGLIFPTNCNPTNLPRGITTQDLGGNLYVQDPAQPQDGAKTLKFNP